MVIAFIKWNPFHHKLRKEYYEGGEYNGYVAFDEELPDTWQGGADTDNDNGLDYKVTVHGGITLDSFMSYFMDEPIIPLTALPEPSVLKTFRVIGFDTLHCNDTREDWPIEEVKKETISLMQQIEKLIAEKQ